MNGLEQEIKGRILGFSPHVTIDYVPTDAGTQPMEEWRLMADELLKLDGVESSYGLVEDYLILEYFKSQVPVNFRAIDTSNAIQVQDLERLLDLEKFPESSADMGFEYEAVISSGLAENVGLGVGDTLKFKPHSTIRDTGCRA